MIKYLINFVMVIMIVYVVIHLLFNKNIDPYQLIIIGFISMLLEMLIDLIMSSEIHNRSMLYGGGVDENNDKIRISDILYSGDLIAIKSGNDIIQRSIDNSQVILDHSPTNLSKLRIENISNSQNPIHYQELVNIKHNALVNNVNTMKFIKYGERLQSHQDGPLFEQFKIVNKDRPNITSDVKYGDHCLIACGDQSGNNVYLKVESDKSISCEATIEQATDFIFDLVQKYKPNNQCVCQNETIYP